MNTAFPSKNIHHAAAIAESVQPHSSWIPHAAADHLVHARHDVVHQHVDSLRPLQVLRLTYEGIHSLPIINNGLGIAKIVKFTYYVDGKAIPGKSREEMSNATLTALGLDH